MKKVFAVVSSFLMAFSLCACGSSDDSTEKVLTVYSPASENLLNAIIPGFEEETGIQVELVQAGTGELFKKLESEASDPQADVLLGGTYSTYLENADLFADYVSKNNDLVLPEYQNTNGFLTSYVLQGSVILVNKDLIGDIEVKGYADLLNPELKGQIASCDPATSSSAFAHLTNMLIDMGGYESDDAWQYVEDLYTNIDGKIISSSGALYKGVAEGEYMVGLSYEDPCVNLVKNGANVEIVYMEEGTVFLASGSAIIKNCKHEENAQLFIDYILSQECQNALGTQTTNRPVLKDVETGDYMKPMDEIVTIEEDTDYVMNHKSEIVDRYEEIFTSIQSK